jgi:hypothetical protein
MSEPITADPAGDHFDPDNRAWQRLGMALADHLDVITWTREDGRPVLLSLVDLHSGDIVTLAVLDSLEIRDPYALLALTTDPVTADPVTADLILTVHGPFDGRATADTYALRLATQDPTVAGGCTVPLHHPGQPTLPDTAWVPLLPAIAAKVAPEPAGAAPVALLLLDRNAGRHALVGPFPHHHRAQAWQPTPPTGPDIERHVLTLRPAPPADPTGWLQP